MGLWRHVEEKGGPARVGARWPSFLLCELPKVARPAKQWRVPRRSGDGDLLFRLLQAILGREAIFLLAFFTNRGCLMKETDIPGKRRGRYIPKFYVFRGFHLSTCYP